MFLMHRSVPTSAKRTTSDALLRRDPFTQLFSMQDAFMRSLFDEPATPRVPVVDVQKLDDHYLISAELPGVKLGDVEVELDGDLLTLKANTGTSVDDEEEGYVRRERSTLSFARSLRLPEDVDVDAVTATLDAGVLQLTLPRQTPPAARKILVTASSADVPDTEAIDAGTEG